MRGLEQQNEASLAAAATQKPSKTLFCLILFLLTAPPIFSSSTTRTPEEYRDGVNLLQMESNTTSTIHFLKNQSSLSTKPHSPLQPHSSVITMDKKVFLAGIRIEPKGRKDDFIGYTEKGVSIVSPHAPVRVVLFGSFMEEIVLVGFTPTQNCSETLMKVVQEDFSIQTAKRIVFLYEFEESKSVYKVCFKQKVADADFEVPFNLIDDIRCSVSTDLPPREYYFPMVVQISIVVALLVLSGLFSGLNLGLMSLTPQELTLISNSGSLKERKYAQMILPVRKSGNQLLCSLLIGNVCVNSAISILFDDLTSGTIALITSSAGIVVFGEIFPQALCVKKGLSVGAHTIWVTRFFMVLTFPLAYPISRILDYLLGDEVVSYDRKRLMELIRLSTKNAIGCPAEELKIAIGAFEMGDKTVKDVMTKIDDVFMIPIDTVLSAKIVAQIVHSGYTRIPVYENTRDNVVSLLFVKDLAILDPDDNFLVKTVCDYYRHPVRNVPENTPLRSMLEEFKKGEYHMALVRRSLAKNELIGLVTLEDIVEEILQAEIVDETDMVTDNVHKTKLKKNNLHFLHLFNDDGGACQISLQMQVVTIQFLEGNFRAFSRDRIAQPILERVIRNHVHKVEVSHLTDISETSSALPRKAKLYTKKQASDKFLLILEGRALITIGQNEMTFEVGPWQYFGTEILAQFDQLIENIDSEQRSNIDSAANSTNNIASTAAPIKAIPSTATEMDRTENRPSLPGLMPVSSTVNQQQPQPLADSIAQDVAKKIKFLPDFSLRIRSECTYLEISAQTYLAMYRGTLMTRNREGVEASGASIAIGGCDSAVCSISGPTADPTFFIPASSPAQQQPQKESNFAMKKEGTDNDALSSKTPSTAAPEKQVLLGEGQVAGSKTTENGAPANNRNGHKRTDNNNACPPPPVHLRTDSEATVSLLSSTGSEDDGKEKLDKNNAAGDEGGKTNAAKPRKRGVAV